MGSFSLQQLLVIWILVGVLPETPERVGFAQMMIGTPGLIFMLWGGRDWRPPGWAAITDSGALPQRNSATGSGHRFDLRADRILAID